MLSVVMKIVGNSNNYPWELIREWGLICQNHFKGGAYSGGGLIREWGLNRSFTVVRFWV